MSLSKCPCLYDLMSNYELKCGKIFDLNKCHTVHIDITYIVVAFTVCVLSFS